VIEFFCPRWGSEHLSWQDFFLKAKQDGYDGVEYAIPAYATAKEIDEVWNIAEKYKMKIIAQHYDTNAADYAMHYDLFCTWMKKIKPYPCAKINSQTGKDYYSFEQNRRLIEAAASSGLNIIHETHRNKFSFAAHIMASYLMRIPGMRITLDASHWVCVAESYLDDQEDAMQLAISKTAHIHARVGHPEGPQVADPRVGEWQFALEKHLQWWDAVVARHSEENTITTVTPEFGPFPYMVNDPIRNQPVADQWEVNLFMMDLMRKRYN
jgi:sugar phosphate isomerase/epimerase